MERENEHKIIGGMFGLAETLILNDSLPSFLKNRNLLLANARSGIRILLDLLSPHQVWMPSYLCNTMLEAIDTETTTIKFYEVNSCLQISSLNWLDDVKHNDLVTVIDYFGFPCDLPWAECVKSQGAWILKDASQALLSDNICQFADFVLYSPRKFLGVPDGGILRFNYNIELNDIHLKHPPAKWWLKAFSASVLRREFDQNSSDPSWFRLFQEANAESPIGPYAMSELSQVLLKHCFNYSKIAQRRVENYQVLSKLLSNFTIFPNLSPKVVPLGFPMRVKCRDKVRQKLFEHQIYPPVHWPIPKKVPMDFKESHQLADEIMTLPCDQRYNTADMERMAQLANEALKC